MKLNWKIKYSKARELSLKFQLVRRAIGAESILTEQIEKVDFPHKVFCIGFGKTGTTSLEAALKKFGFKMGNQAVAEMLVEDWYNKRYDRILGYCETAEAFQDVPFGAPGMYKVLDEHFHGSKFILTERDTPSQWFRSLVRFHAKKFAKDKVSIPTEEELENAKYRYKGWQLDVSKYLFNYPNVPLYSEDYYINLYENHIIDVKNHFKNRPDDLLVINVGERGSYQELASFLEIDVNEDDDFPWLNKT